MNENSITGTESWLDTPAGRAWRPLYDRLPEAYRWAPEQVAAAMVEAERIIGASTGRVGPGGAGGSWIAGAIGGGSPSLRFLPHEVTWAQSVAGWPGRYLLDESDLRIRRAEREAVRLWLRRESGDRLTPAERALYKTPAHRKARRRGLVWIAAGLMRERVPVQITGAPAEPVEAAPETEVTTDAPERSGAVWHAPDAAPLAFRHDETLDEKAALVECLAADVRDAIAKGERRGHAVTAIVAAHVREEYESAPEGLRREVAEERRFLDLRAAVIRAVLDQERAERASA